LEGDIRMENSKETERGEAIFQTGLFDNLTLQDSFTVIALYAARVDPEDCQAEIRKITALLNDHSIFDEKSSDTRTRVNKFINSMEQVKSLDAVQKAAAVLSPELRQGAFMLALEISKSVQESLVETVPTLNNLASKLSIDSEIVDQTINSIIKNVIDEIDDKGIFALARASNEKQIMITRWAQDIYDRFESVLKNHPAKIKNTDELPASKPEVKIAIKILLTAYFLKESGEMVDRLKERYISIGTFQNIDMEDKEKIYHSLNNIELELKSDYESVFPEYHKYMEVIISEQNVLLDDVNNFIDDLRKVKK
jgi:hypothetical protein